MSQSNVKVSTEALSGLNDKLMNLAGCLHDIYKFMVDNMKKIGEDAWQDHKYQEFVEGYSPQILKCDNIADRYERWCKDAITPLLGKAEKVDSATVTLDGVGSSSGSGSAATAGAAVSDAKSSKAAEFNTGTRKVVARPNSNPKREQVRASQIEPQQKQKKAQPLVDDAQQLSETADVLCANPSVKRAKLSAEESLEGGSWGINGEAGGKGKIWKAEASAKVGAHYDSGKTSSKFRIDEVEIDCSEHRKENN